MTHRSSGPSPIARAGLGAASIGVGHADNVTFSTTNSSLHVAAAR
ncbi:hypothetical protein [Streptomyces sp. NPDC053367]